MRETFSDDNIEFISVSIDDDKSYWKEHVVDNKLNTNEYWLKNENNSPLHSLTYSIVEMKGNRIALISLPTFTLIGPDGTILDREFTRPSKEEFERDIREVLKGS